MSPQGNERFSPICSARTPAASWLSVAEEDAVVQLANRFQRSIVAIFGGSGIKNAWSLCDPFSEMEMPVFLMAWSYYTSWYAALGWVKRIGGDPIGIGKCVFAFSPGVPTTSLVDVIADTLKQWDSPSSVKVMKLHKIPLVGHHLKEPEALMDSVCTEDVKIR